MKVSHKTRLLRLRERLSIHEAAYLVQEALGGHWHDAVALLSEIVEGGSIPSDIKPLVNPWHGNVIGTVDPAKTTIATADVLAWLKVQTAAEGAIPGYASRAVTYADIVRQFRIEPSDMDDWPAPGLRLRSDGIWAKEPEHYKDSGLTPDEFAALVDHPSGDYSQPALKLPCTVQELADFLRWVGCEDYIRLAQHDFVVLLLPALQNAELTMEYQATHIGPRRTGNMQARAHDQSGAESNFIPSEAQDFPLDERQCFINAEYWEEREFAALCLGVKPASCPYPDRGVIDSIRQAIESGELYAERLNPSASRDANRGERYYGGIYRFHPARTVQWALAHATDFPQFPEWLTSSGLAEKAEQQDAEKRAEGRYTLKEAADAIAKSGECAQDILEKLESAAESDVLPVHRPGMKSRYRHRPDLPKPTYFEAYWGDLNEWLAKYEPRIAFRFFPPQASAAPPPDTSAADASGLTKRERQIMAIEAGADALGYVRTAVPTGGKGRIMDWCKSNHSNLFGAGDEPFKDAWKEASKKRRVTMKNRAKFAGR